MTEPDAVTEPRTPALEARAIGVGYPGREVIHDLSLAIPQGVFTVLLGPNGSGKSTLLRALAGLLPPSRGQITLDGTPMLRLSSRKLARRLSLLPQSPRAPDDITVRDLVVQGRYPHRGLFDLWSRTDEAACAEALNLTGLENLASQPLAQLSGGQRQRAWIAITLAQAADILLLDEPTTYLDIAHQLEVMELLGRLVRERGKTVVAILHDINQAARHADCIVLLRDGKIAAIGTPDEVVRAGTIGDVFDIDVTILADPTQEGRPVCVPRRRRISPDSISVDLAGHSP